LTELEELFDYLKTLQVRDYEFNPTLARGLAYYTGPIYEIYLKKSKVVFSVAGGGRYDDFIGNFLGKNQQIPATGIAFGLEPITEAIKLSKKGFEKSVSQIYVIPIKTAQKSLEIAQQLRGAGFRVDIDLMQRSLSKNLDYASKLGIGYVVIIGEIDLQNRQGTIRNMETGKEQKISIKDITKFQFK
ncbi:ATP phosphoribosyltransferase regulatory subunit, partial [Candidatus Woesearchaeota archaeon]|nr:ATP phosphoribosyltransferase regulatory subunit [Candidatus Woesearchaeota archaeon]